MPNGATLRNRDGKGTGNTRWCHVATPGGRYDGWVSGRYLREGVAPTASGPSLHIPTGSAVTRDLYTRPTGETEVLWSGGCTVL